MIEIRIKNLKFELELKGDPIEVKDFYLMVKEDLLSKLPESIPNDLHQFPKSNSVGDGIASEETIDLGRSSKSKTGVRSSKKVAKPQKIVLSTKFDEKKFCDVFGSKKLKSNKDKILLAVYLYKQQTNEDTITTDLVHTLLDKAAIDTPDNLKQFLTNYVNQEKLLERVSDGFKLKYTGEEYCKKILMGD